MSDIEPKKTSAAFQVPEWVAEGARVQQALYAAIQRDIAESMSPDPAVRQARKERMEKAREDLERRAKIEFFEAESRYIVAWDGSGERLKAVMELHQPQRGGFGTKPKCSTCLEGGWETEPVEWPCDTWLAAIGEER